MVWFPNLRPKFRKVAACMAIITALASAGSEIQELEFKSYQQAKFGYSEIFELKQVREKNEKAMKDVEKMLIEAVYMKSYAEKLSKEGKAEESKKAYRGLLNKYEQIIGTLTTTQIALAKNDIIKIKNKLKNNKFFDANRAGIRVLEEDIYNAWVEVDRLTKSVSSDVQEVERILGIIN